MANRLLGRCARLLCRASSQTHPGAASAAAHLPVLVAGSVESQRAQGWPLVMERFMCAGIVDAEDHPISHPRTRPPLEELIESAREPNDILLAWEKHGGCGNQAASALTRWTNLMTKKSCTVKEILHVMKEDSRIVDIRRAIQNEVPYLWNSTLVYLLQVLWILDVPSADILVKSVQNEVLWRQRRLTLKHLGFLVDKGAYKKGGQNAAIVNAALKQLELRWTEIDSPKTISALIARGQIMSPNLIDRLEDKALELAENFTSGEIVKVCKALAAQSRRTVPLLRSLSYHLHQKPSSEFTSPLILDMTFAYARLNFHHPQLFQRMASELLPRVPTLKSHEVTHCAKSLGFLKWLHFPLFDAFAEHYIKDSQSYNTLHSCNLLMTFARLNFLPSKGEQFFSKVHSVLEGTLSGLEPFMQTDVIWSLCVLQQAKPHYLIPLTRREHVEKLSGPNPVREENYRQKLLHIAATLQLEHLGSADLSSSLRAMFFPINTPHRGEGVAPVESGLKDALESLVGKKTEALRTMVDTVYGWTIVGELVVDRDNKPIDISMLEAPHLPSGGGNKALPDGSRRLAFLVWNYPNFCSMSKDLLGRFVMMKRHLELAGFIPVEVPYSEWLPLKTEWQKLGYLKDKIGKAVAKDMAK